MDLPEKPLEVVHIEEPSLSFDDILSGTTGNTGAVAAICGGRARAPHLHCFGVRFDRCVGRLQA
jgi:hypothetical protein